MNYSDFETQQDMALTALLSLLLGNLVSDNFVVREASRHKGIVYVGYSTSGHYYALSSNPITSKNGRSNPAIIKKLKFINSILDKLLPHATKLIRPGLVKDMKYYPGRVAYDIDGKNKLKVPVDKYDNVDLDFLNFPKKVLFYNDDKGFVMGQETFKKLKQELNKL